MRKKEIKNEDIVEYNSNNIVHNEYKFKFIIDYLGIPCNDIAIKLGLSVSSISKMRNPYTNATQNNSSGLKNVHFYALESAYNIPKEIFFDKSIKTESQIKYILDNKKQYLNSNLFSANEILLKKLTATWYSYFYPSNKNKSIYCIETTINEKGEVLDENNNAGELYLGKNQSMIIKEADNSKNLISMTFDNNQVAFGIFSFTLVSKTNINQQKMYSYGFLSRKKIDLISAKAILGDLDSKQLKLDCKFEERLVEYI